MINRLKRIAVSMELKRFFFKGRKLKKKIPVSLSVVTGIETELKCCMCKETHCNETIKHSTIYNNVAVLLNVVNFGRKHTHYITFQPILNIIH